MDKPNSTAGRIFYYLWYGLDLTRRIFFNLIFVIILLVFMSSIFSGGDKVIVPKGSALVFAPKGVITEQPVWVDPIEKALNDAMDNKQPGEESVYDLIEILRNAKDDDRITTLVIYPQGILSVGPAMLEMLRDALIDFKESGKKVYAMGDFYGQPQYYLASLADEVYVHPHGGVFIEGYSRVRTYYAALLENLKVTANVFKVGKYKSAIEPYLRNDMSEYAKEANLAYLGDIWGSFKTDIAAARNISADDIDSMINNFDQSMIETGGDWAKVAQNHKLVDGTKTRPEFRSMMVELVGEDTKKTSFKQIHHRDYLKAISSPFDIVNPRTDKIAVIVAKGAIMDGSQKEGTIGGDTLAEKIRRARMNDKTKAIVLRVDSPGGSAFASEIIREEILAAKAQGLPVIASMGTYAASGGYWISANADQIWARPTTITGSIGIFGLIPTFEKSLAWAGISRDGVGTTQLAGSFDTGRALKQPIKTIIQSSIENGYRRFLSIVSEGRNMSTEDVDSIAQGRVWSGKKAKELGLVDELGTLKDAINAAAKAANLADGGYDTWVVKRHLTKNEELMQNLFNSSFAGLLEPAMFTSKTTSTDQFLLKMHEEIKALGAFNDPNHTYVHCNCVVE